jgi:hypothetical protein
LPLRRGSDKLVIMTDNTYQAILEGLLEVASKHFGIPEDKPELSDLPAGKMLTWPVAGTPGVGEWYEVAVSLTGNTLSIENCYYTEDISRSDDVRQCGQFDLNDPKVLDLIEDCFRQIAQHPTFRPDHLL